MSKKVILKYAPIGWGKDRFGTIVGGIDEGYNRGFFKVQLLGSGTVIQVSSEGVIRD